MHKAGIAIFAGGDSFRLRKSAEMTENARMVKLAHTPEFPDKLPQADELCNVIYYYHK